MSKIVLLFVTTFIANMSLSQIKYNKNYPTVQLKGTQLITFKSAINQHNYEIYVGLPSSYNDSSANRYPVLYVLDGQWFFPTVIEMRESMHYEGYLPEMIVVGIGWPDNYHANRNRDFFPVVSKDSTNGNGAQLFLHLLKNEIMKFVDSSYRTDKNNILQGQSAGGAFALYTLFHEPTVFKSYIVSCPSLEYDEGIFFNYEKQFAEKHSELPVNLFVTSSEYEEAMTAESLFRKFIDELKKRNYKGLNLDTIVVEKMGHATQYAYAIGRGLQFVFSRPDLELDNVVLERYVGHYDFNIAVTREGKSIYATFSTGRVRLHAQTSEIFYVNGVPGTTEFIKDDKGRVSGFQMKAEGNVNVVKKLD
jgi:predicted alpha/beta superfamily hydrolase